MKIYINKYKDHWISPYTMLDYIFFWKDWSKCSRTWKIKDSVDDVDNIEKGEKSRFIERPDWVDTWSDRLVPISMAIQWVWDKVDRKINYVKIDRWDTWGMDHTLAKIVLPMLKQLKDTKHGSAIVDLEDVPEGVAAGMEDSCCDRQPLRTGFQEPQPVHLPGCGREKEL